MLRRSRGLDAQRISPRWCFIWRAMNHSGSRTAMIVDGGLTLGPNLSAMHPRTALREPPPNVYVGPSFKR
jgi:hypothetical protein